MALRVFLVLFIDAASASKSSTQRAHGSATHAQAGHCTKSQPLSSFDGIRLPAGRGHACNVLLTSAASIHPASAFIRAFDKNETPCTCPSQYLHTPCKASALQMNEPPQPHPIDRKALPLNRPSTENLTPRKKPRTTFAGGILGLSLEEKRGSPKRACFSIQGTVQITCAAASSTRSANGGHCQHR
jgi:hypothetical protein